MAYRCDYCHKGKQYGHAVSHAKNRLRRFFIPNLQKLVVFQNGKSAVKVKFCTGCIKRLKKDGRLGNLFLKMKKPAVSTPKKVVEKIKEAEKSQKKVAKKTAAKPLDIASIVGKKK